MRQESSWESTHRGLRDTRGWYRLFTMHRPSSSRRWDTWGVCTPGVLLRNKSINFFIVLVLHRGQNSNAASRRKRAARRREWDPSSYTGLQLKSVKRRGKLPGKQLATHVLWPLHSHCFWSVCVDDSPPKTFLRVVECSNIRVLISYRQWWWFRSYPWIWCTC